VLPAASVFSGFDFVFLRVSVVDFLAAYAADISRPFSFRPPENKKTRRSQRSVARRLREIRAAGKRSLSDLRDLRF
jgi:hypothetical protein